MCKEAQPRWARPSQTKRNAKLNSIQIVDYKIWCYMNSCWIYLWLILVDVWQKITEFCKTNILQLKNKWQKQLLFFLFLLLLLMFNCLIMLYWFLLYSNESAMSIHISPPAWSGSWNCYTTKVVAYKFYTVYFPTSMLCFT